MTPAALLAAAEAAMERAYAPYSGYRVGAALLCADGTVYTGCNIENAAFTPTVCAERVALFKAVSDGRRGFEAIAVVSGKEGRADGGFPPCGVCRQALAEFCGPELKVYMRRADGSAGGTTLGELLPEAFGPGYLS